jgi:hypothetical protein
MNYSHEGKKEVRWGCRKSDIWISHTSRHWQPVVQLCFRSAAENGSESSLHNRAVTRSWLVAEGWLPRKRTSMSRTIQKVVPPRAASGARRFGGRRPDIGPHDLVEPTCPGEGRAVRPRNVAARPPVQGVYRCCIESIWRCPLKHRARDSGDPRPLRHDQHDAPHVLAGNCRACSEGHGYNDDHLLRT